MVLRLGRILLAVAIIATMVAVPVSGAAALTSSTYRDEFLAGFSGSDGSLAWSTDWLETGESDGVGGGAIEVVTEPHCLSLECLVVGRFGPSSASVQRGADLSAMPTATLRFDFKRHVHDAGAGQVHLEISANGGIDWTQLEIWNLNATDPATVTAAYDITPYRGADTRIRFRLTNSTDQSHFNVDNLEIAEGNWAFVESAQSSKLDALHVADSLRAWAAGDGGTIIATTDGGATWQSQNSGVIADLDGVFFINPTQGVAVGDGGTIVKTTDGGTLWSVIPSGTPENLNAVTFVDANRGFAVGASATALTTPDGGDTWTAMAPGTAFNLKDVFFVDANTGWIVGNQGTIVTTSNGGADWSSQASGTGNHLRSVFFTGANRGFAVGDAGTLVETTNGGATWTASNLGAELKSVHFVDSNTGFIGGSGGSVFRTTDGGTTWHLEPVPTVDIMQSIHFSGAADGFVVGNNGTILTRFNAAQTLPSVVDPGDQAIAAGSPFSLTITANDPENDPLTLTASGIPGWATFADNGDGTATISGTPSNADAGISTVDVTADDGFAGIDTEGFDVLVTERASFYVVGSDGTDLLTNVDANDVDPSTNEGDIGPTGTDTMGGLSFQPGSGTLFGVDDDQVGTIDLTTGLFTPLPSTIGTANGAKGLVVITNATGLAFEHSSGFLYGTVDTGVGQRSLLFRIDPATGAFMPGVFAGDDYIEIQEKASRKQISDIAFNPADGLLYGVQHDGADYSLITLDATTGTTLDLGITKANTAGIDFDAFGQLWGTDETPGNGLLVKLSSIDGSMISMAQLDNASGYAALAILGNNPPTFNQDLGDRSHPEGTAITPLPSPATDPDLGDNLLYSATGLPPGLSIVPASGTITGTISTTGAGTYSTEITVTDDGVPSLSDTDTFTWTITNVNEAPSFDQDLLDRTDAENATVSLSAAASDDDTGDTLLYGATGLPPGLSIDSGSGLIGGTIDFTAAAGSPYSVSITVQDDGAPVMSAPPDTFTWTITNTNRPPVVDPIADQSVAENDPFSLTVTASDPDGTTPSLSASGLPAWATFTDNTDGTATITGTPGYADSGITAVTITAGDGSLTANAVFDIVVVNTDRNPVVDPIGDQSVAENNPFSLTVTATDPDGLTPAISDSGTLPGWATLVDNADGTATITGTPGFSDAGLTTVTITADDGALTGAASFDLNVTNTNRAPTLTPMADASVAENDPLTLVATASDPDGTTPSLSATGLPGWATFTDNLDGTATISGTPGYSDAATSTIVVTASDGFLTGSAGFNLNVTNTNRPPVVDPIADQSVAEGDPFTLTITSLDPDGTIPSLSATGLPLWASFTDNLDGTATISGTPGFEDSGAHAVTVTVSDGGTPNLTDADLFRLAVTNTNRAPLIPNPGTQTATEGAPFVLTLTGTDPDGTIPTFTADVVPSWASFTDNLDGTATLSGTPGYADSGVAPVTITVDDGFLTTTAAFDIVINNTDRPPVIDPIADQIVAENDPFTLTVGATDPDGLTPAFSAGGTLPTWAALIDNGDGTATISGTPGYGAAGTTAVTITASDGALTDTAGFNLKVTDTNQAPIVAPLADQFPAEGAPFALAVFSTDPDGPSPALSASGLPGWTTFTDNGDGTAKISGTPGFTDAGASLVTITASDGVLTGTATFLLTVTDTNRPPTVGPIADGVVAEGSPYSIVVTAGDPDGTVPSLSASGLPGWAGIVDHGDGTATIAGTPGFNDAGQSTVKVIADDGALVATRTFKLTVTDVNRAPALTNPGPQSLPENHTFDIDVTASDPDGDPVTITASGLPSWASFTTGPSNAGIDGTPTAADAGLSTITLSATDGTAVTAVTFTIEVTVPNNAPIVSVTGGTTTAESVPLGPVAISGTDPDGTSVTITAAGLPPWAIFTPDGFGGATITGTPGYDDAGTSNATITVTDPGGLATTRPVIIAVTNTNRPATGAWSGATTTAEGATLGPILLAVADPDGDPITIVVVAAPSWVEVALNADDATAVITGTPGYDAAGQHEILIHLLDGTDTTTLTIAVDVAATNRVPSGTDDSTTTNEDTAVTLSVLDGYADPDGDALTLASVSDPAHGTASIGSDGTIVYSPDPGFNGTDSFSYTVHDAGGGSFTSRVSVTVLAAYLAAYTEKAVAGLLVKAMDADLAPPTALADGGRPSLSPTDGLRVAFGAAAESLKSQILPALLLGILIAWLLILGIGRREDEETA